MKMSFASLLAVVVLFFALTGFYIHAEDIQFPAAANVLNITAAPYNAVGDGMTDDTTAIQNAINDSLNTGHTIYFPNGTYKVTAHLTLGSNIYQAKFVTFQGESQAGVVIRLGNSLAAFQNPSSPVSLLCTCELSSATGQAFGVNLYSLTIDVGSGNPGATALQYVADNQAIVENVTLRSSDPGYVGLAGLDLRGSWPLCLIKNLTVVGFNYGVWAPNNWDYSVWFEGLSLSHQLVAGVSAAHQVMGFRNFTSVNSVPALQAGDWSCPVITGNFTGGSSSVAAIQSKGGAYLLRNITTSGYGRVLDVNGTPTLTGSSVTEATSSAPVSLFSSTPMTTLNLPVVETPDPGWSDPASNWVVAAPGGSTQVQAAIDSAAAAGKLTVCIPWQSTAVNFTSTVHIHGSVTRVMMMSSLITVSNPLLSSTNPLFSVDSPDNSTVVIDRCCWSNNAGQTSPFIFAYHNSNCTLVLKDIASGGQMYQCAPGKTGTVIIEDVAGDGFTFSPGQKVYCHYINPEGNAPATMIVNNGATLWICGLKHEVYNTVITTNNGGTTELLNALLYPSGGGTTTDIPFVVNNSTFSGSWTESVGANYIDFAQVTRGSSTQTLATSSLPNAVQMPLFVERPPAVATPTFSPAGGTFTTAQAVAMSDATGGAAIYYTTDGSPPTTASALYTAPITVSATKTINAIAVASGMLTSNMGTAEFTITSPGLTWTATQFSSTTDYSWNAPVTFPAVNLTTTGTTDWAYWAWSSSTPTIVNYKASGSGIGPMTVNKTTGQCGTVSGATRFSFTDGTSPVSGTNVNSGVGLQREATWAGIAVPEITFTAPIVSGTSTLYVWFSGSQCDSVALSAWNGSTQIGSTVLAPVGGASSQTAFVYKYQFGGAATPGTITFKFDMVNGEQDQATLVVDGAALVAPAGPPTWTASQASVVSDYSWNAPVSFPAANLTSLGPTDWAYWTWSATNMKGTGSGIGPLTANKSTGEVGGVSGTSSFSFTDGTSPATGTNVAAGAGLLREATWEGIAVPELSYTVTAGPSTQTMYVWFSGSQCDSVALSAWNGSTQVGTTVNAAIGGANTQSAYVYKYQFGGFPPGTTITFKFDMVNGEQDGASLVLHGAAF